MPALTTTRTRTVLFDRDLVGKLAEVVDLIRQDWEGREPYVSDPEIRRAAEARLGVADGLVEILKDPAE